LGQDHPVLVDSTHIPVRQFEDATAWELKPEGACRGDMCVPLPPGAVVDGLVDVVAATGRLGMPVVHDEAAGLWAIGPSSQTGRALESAEAPELALPNVDGDEFRLSSLRGTKVVLVAWAPY
jgi:hypothetical protein